MPHNDILAKLKDAIRSVSDNIQYNGPHVKTSNED